jgi:PIN domain nuclease of toxin-antitoxin system
LSRRALEIIQEAELYGTIYVSVITLMEIVDLSEKGRISISFTDVASTIEENEAYQIVPFDEELLKVAITFSF